MPAKPRLKTCPYCGKEFASPNPKRLYCSERCRRDFQNEARRDVRAEAAEVKAASHWGHDPWADMAADDAWDGVWANALLDPAPILGDAPWGGIQTTLPERKPEKQRKRKKKDRYEGQMCLPGMEAWLS